MSTRTDNPQTTAHDLVLRSKAGRVTPILLTMVGIALLFTIWPVRRFGPYAVTLCFVLAMACLIVALACSFARHEITLLRDQKTIRVRHHCRLRRAERVVPFEQVRAVRLTMARNDVRPRRLQLLCFTEEIDLPLTPVARQQALCLAVMLNVQYIRVHGQGASGHTRLLRNLRG